MHGLGGSCHRLQESVLILYVLPQSFHHLLVAGSVDVSLTVGRRHANAGVLQHAAESAHRVSLEVSQINHEVIVLQVRAYDVILNVRRILHGYLELALLVHQVHVEARREAMVANHLPVVFKGHALALVGGVALNDGASHLVHQLSYQLRLQIVGVSSLAGRDFHGHAALSLAAKGMVDFHKRLWADVASHVDFCRRVHAVFCLLIFICSLGCVLVPARRAHQHASQQQRCHCKTLSHIIIR